MSLLFRGHRSALPWCKPKAANNAEIVVPNLAITPSQIAQMTRQGIAVSTPNAESFIYENCSGWDIEPVYQRYYDRNTAWETSNNARIRLANANKKDRELFK